MPDDAGKLEQIWFDSCAETGLEKPTDFGDPDRYVYLGDHHYAGLSVVSGAYRRGLTEATGDDSVELLRQLTLESKYPHLLGDERWSTTALTAVAKTIGYNRDRQASEKERM